jgi:hypothetical protein
MQQTEPRITYREGIIRDGEVVEGKEIPAPRPLWQPRKGHEKPGEDDFVVADSRARRRAAQRGQRGERRKMQRRFVRRERRKEWEQNQLAQLFNLVDNLVPCDRQMRLRADTAIYARVAAIRKQEQARYDREIKARQKNRNLPAPKPVISHDEILQRLRGLAKTAPTVVPKQRRKELVADGRRSLPGPLTTGRTGRAG